jgi:hypothetical protein
MTSLRVFRLLVLIVVLAVGPAALGLPFLPGPAVVSGDEGKDEAGKGDDKDGEDEKKEKEKEKDDERGGDEKGVAPVAGYRVEVTCDFNPTSVQTTCTFAGQAPDGGKDVGHVDLPAEEVCAPVVGGDAEYVDPDPNTRVVGYKSRGGEGRFTLEIEGEVVTGGTATYWFKTCDGVFPARGPGLVCGGADRVAEDAEPDEERSYELQTPAPSGTAAPATTPGPVLTPDPPETDGTILVQAYACDVATAPEGYDWYGACEPAAAGTVFRLEVRREAGLASQATASTDADGRATFEALSPGDYRLTQVDTDWCHAESDNVDGQGDVVVEAGGRATVWVFACAGAP